MSDSISEIDIDAGTVVADDPAALGDAPGPRRHAQRPGARGETLYVADGGDNALAEIDLNTGRVRGFRHAGYFPTAVALSHDGKTAFVLNTKGNGSVRQDRSAASPATPTTSRAPSPSSTFDRPRGETGVVARNNRWEAHPGRPPLKVYNGAIKHVLYIIKENRTYDEVFGDLPQGDGDPKLCSLGETVMPNHRKIAREFTLFDNGYVSGTNSADGHAWSTQAWRTTIWNTSTSATRGPIPTTATTRWRSPRRRALGRGAQEGQTGPRLGRVLRRQAHQGRPQAEGLVRGLGRPQVKGTQQVQVHRRHATSPASSRYINPEVHYWPLLQSDQFRADIFIKEYERVQPDGQGPRPDDPQPPVRPRRGDQPEVSHARAP